MSEGRPSQYQCAGCGGVFDKVWSDEEALAELSISFPGVPPVECGVVCDDCFKKMPVVDWSGRWSRGT